MSIPTATGGGTRVATPVYTDAAADGTEPVHCANCGVPLIRNYDGPGTGWSHYPETDRPGMYRGRWTCED